VAVGSRGPRHHLDLVVVVVVAEPVKDAHPVRAAAPDVPVIDALAVAAVPAVSAAAAPDVPVIDALAVAAVPAVSAAAAPDALVVEAGHAAVVAFSLFPDLLGVLVRSQARHRTVWHALIQAPQTTR
jgi:hypothetical protein